MNNLSKMPTWYWLLAVVVVIWNALGVMTYLADSSISDEALAALPDVKRSIINHTPSWVNAANAAVVFGGLLGGIFLLLRYKLATTAFIITLIGLLLQMLHHIFIANTYEVLTPFIIIMPLMLMLFASGLIWFSITATRKGWLS